MAGGRPAKSVAQHKLDGTYRADRHANTLAADALKKAPKPPAHLSKQEASAWKRITANLVEIGVLCPIDLPQIERYFEIRRNYEIARDGLEKMGLLIVQEGSQGQTREITNPMFGIMMECHRRMLEIEEKYGFSPTGRRKITIDPSSDADDQIAKTIWQNKGLKWEQMKNNKVGNG